MSRRGLLSTLVVLSIVVLMTWLASNLVHGRIGRMWMAVRDMDLAAELIGIRLLPAEELGVKPGDVITYYARARDVGRGKRSTEATSDIYFLEVKPFNEEYSLAQSQAMAASTGNQLEGLISAQKEIISATWNLERRSGAGRSAADIKGVADAQAELKARAEQAAGQQRVGGDRRAVEQHPDVPGRHPRRGQPGHRVLEGEARQHAGPLALVELQNGGAEPTYVAGTENFYVVTRYNWSSYYAMAVIELGREVREAMAR